MSIQLEKFIHPKNGTRPVDQRNVKPRTQIQKFVDEWEYYIVDGYKLICRSKIVLVPNDKK